MDYICLEAIKQIETNTDIVKSIGLMIKQDEYMHNNMMCIELNGAKTCEIYKGIGYHYLDCIHAEICDCDEYDHTLDYQNKHKNFIN